MADNDLIEMPFLRNIGYIMTYKCQAACPHCIIEAGPHRKEEMRLADALEWASQIAQYRNGYIKVLSLTGGEPFYNIDALKTISDFAGSQGLIVSAVTNAYWANNLDDAIHILQGLPAIRMLAISTDTYHQLYIPFERIKNAIDAARSCNVPFNIHVCTDNENDAGYKKVLEQLLEVTDEDSINTAVTFPAGRALKKVGMDGYQTSSEPSVSACSAGSSPIIFPDGRVIACIGAVIDLKSDHPLMLGNLREEPLQQILDRAELNPILHAIRVWGPRKLISIIAESEYAQYLPGKYIKDSMCNACYQLMESKPIVDYLSRLAQDAEFQQKVAYARLYYLNESRMLEIA